jgi:formate-dependent nitrite reductase membrane component NrfD
LAALGTTLVLLLATTVLLVKDLDRPGRFAYVLLRPNWTSWITRGGYILTLFTVVTGLLLVNVWFGWSLRPILAPMGLLLAFLTAVYTAFLLAQARGRDLWRSPATSVRMLAQALTAGVVLVVFIDPESFQALRWFLGGGLAVQLALQLLEVFTPHGSIDAARAGRQLTHGTLAIKFYSGIVVGGLVPLALLLLVGGPAFLPLGLMVLGGLLLTEYVWIRAPQLVPLS